MFGSPLASQILISSPESSRTGQLLAFGTRNWLETACKIEGVVELGKHGSAETGKRDLKRITCLCHRQVTLRTGSRATNRILSLPPDSYAIPSSLLVGLKRRKRANWAARPSLFVPSLATSKPNGLAAHVSAND